MITIRHLFRFAAALAAALFAAVPTAHAYIDPGAGSLLWQAAVGAILGFIYLCKLYWRSARGAISKLLKRRGRRE